MNEDIFKAMAAQMRPDKDVLASLEARLGDAADHPGAEPTVGRRRRTGWVAAAACLLVLASGTLLPGAIGHGSSIDLADPPQPPAAAPAAPVDARDTGAAKQAHANVATGYESLYAAVLLASRNQGYDPMRRSPGFATGGSDDVASMPARAQGGAVRAGAVDSGAVKGGYQTNAQVAGIDEGDIVKSDGTTLYVASGKQVAVLAAEGGSTRVVARIDTGEGEAADTSAVKGKLVAQGPVADMMLYGTTLVVVVTDYAADAGSLPSSVVSTYLPLEASVTKALLYDVSDPSRPRYLSSLGQSGAVVTSRLLDGVLYLVTEYLVSDPDSIKPGDPATFVPLVTRDGVASVVPARDAIPLPYAQGPRYAVASSIDLAARKRIDSEAVLGGSQTVYMSADNLYLAASDYEATLSAAQRKSAGVDDLRAGTGATHLARIALKAGELTLAAQASVPGQVLNQFALDEYEGHLRLATTVTGESKGGSWVTRPALYVLDAKLKLTGSLPKLATNESVQSVRFDGKVGYVVSFERRDPLFAIDLADPKKPKVMSALKIPGFSTYLDTWADGLLLGLGVDTGDDGAMRGLKLSMFDTSDLFDVTEQKKTKVDFDDSEALSNHKAVLVDRERGLIGFPALKWNDEGASTLRYLVYGYDPQKGFALKKQLPVKAGDGWPVGVRGLRIDDALYVASQNGVEVYSTSSFGKLAAVDLG